MKITGCQLITKHMKKLLTLFLCIFHLFTYSQGLITNEKYYNTLSDWHVDDLGFSEKLPSSYSLRKYCPPVGNQGNYGTCVGWATSYAGMSIMHNIQNNITKSSEKLLYAFDPLYIYTIVKDDEDVDCGEGIPTKNAVIALSQYGCKRLFIAEKTGCIPELSDEIISYGKPFKINQNISKLPERENKLELIKNKVAQNKPLIIGVKYSNPKFISNGLWDFNSKNSLGGHAMCLIGYDDNKFGGSFEIMNSWGKESGDNGFIWIKYEDFFNVVDEVYLMNLKNENSDPNISCQFGDCYNGYSQQTNNNNTYEGEFQEKLKNGIGFEKLENGDIFIGTWKKNKRNGDFIVYQSDEKKWYKRKYNNGIKTPGFEEIEDDELGFGSQKPSNTQELINGLHSFGILKIK